MTSHNDSDISPELLDDFRQSLSRFRCASSPTASPNRASPSRSPKGKRSLTEPDDGSPRKKQKKRPRPFAAPEVYAHLNSIPDYLTTGLDIIFCGINPSTNSAACQGHYAHPTNHFWKSMFESGFTEILLQPKQGRELLEKYNIGLTNLVERPTKEQSEIAPSEFAQGVKPFLKKISTHRPRMVVLLGLNIANVVHRGATGKGAGTIPIGIMPFKIVYIHSNVPNPTETLFYALPSPSARVVGYQLVDKIELFRQLRNVLAAVKAGSFDSSQLLPIDLDGVLGTSKYFV